MADDNDELLAPEWEEEGGDQLDFTREEPVQQKTHVKLNQQLSGILEGKGFS